MLLNRHADVPFFAIITFYPLYESLRDHRLCWHVCFDFDSPMNMSWFVLGEGIIRNDSMSQTCIIQWFIRILFVFLYVLHPLMEFKWFRTRLRPSWADAGVALAALYCRFTNFTANKITDMCSNLFSSITYICCFNKISSKVCNFFLSCCLNCSHQMQFHTKSIISTYLHCNKSHLWSWETCNHSV